MSVKKRKPRCIFYPQLTCPVRAEMEKEDLLSKIVKPDLRKLPDESQIVMKLGEAVKQMIDFKMDSSSAILSAMRQKTGSRHEIQSKTRRTLFSNLRRTSS